MDNLINNIATAGNEWRNWRELLNEMVEADKGNYKVMFDEDGFFTDNENDFDDYNLDGDCDRDFAIEKNDKAYDNYNDAIEELAKHIGAEISLPYGNSWYLTKNMKTVTFRDHKLANSTCNYHNEIWSVRHNNGINLKDLTSAIKWLTA